MSANEKMTADDALREIGRVSDTVQRSSRWGGKWFLVMGIASAVYWTAMLFGPDSIRHVAVWGWIAFTVASCVYVFRQGVYNRLLCRLQYPIAGMYLLTMTGAMLFGMLLLPESDLGPGWIAAGLGVALLSGAPLLYGAWRLLVADGTEDRR